MSASGYLNSGTQIVNFTAAATGAVTITSINGVAVPANASGFFSTKFAEGYLAELVLTASTGTVDGALQHSTDGGITFRTLPLKFAQVAAGPGSAMLAFKPMIGLSDIAYAGTPALTGAAVAINIPFQQKAVRLFLTLGTAGTTTGQLILTLNPKGNVLQ